MADKLAKYRSKRDFTRTAEPRGEPSPAPADYPRFVIQKHAATRLHYDLRLEVGGVFKSWAVTRGPSLDPADKRLAVEVEDHPLEYGDFEGTIPKGEYGGGTVMLWDRGFWQPVGDLTPEKALAKGELKFVLAGEKLRGGYVLVRLRNDRESRGKSKRTNWLLIKHRDGTEEVGAGLPDDDRSVASGRSMEEIAKGKGKGPKPFIATGGTRAPSDAVWSSASPVPSAQSQKPKRAAKSRAKGDTPSPPPAFVEPQLCTLVDRPPTGGAWVHEIKLDGYRMQLRVAGSEASMRTRKGLDWTDKFRAIADAGRVLPDTVVDGEVVVLDENGVPDFAGLQAALSSGQQDRLVYFVFDLMFSEGEDLREAPLQERKDRLERLLSEHGLGNGTGPIRYLAHLAEPGDAVLRSACHMSLEGIVSKRLDCPYRSGRGMTWTKAKCRGGQEVVIGGWSGNARTLRSLLVGVHRDGRLMHAGRVGTGFTERTSREILARLKPLVVSKSPFDPATAPRKAADVTWVEPRLVAEIEFAGWTGTGMVRQAAFQGLREDKQPSEITIEKPARAKEVETPSGKKGKAGVPRPPPPAKPGDNTVMGVVISSPTKPLWPAPQTDPPITKLDLAHYLEAVADKMLEHIGGRPCSIIRAPEGIGGEQFFQRHAGPGTSNLVTLTTVSGDRKPYLQFDRREALAAMAQIAAVEFHPWNCEPGEPDVPGRLVFDLDPAPDLPFAEVVAAAKEMRERLEAIGLVAFCKTTGGKGLHVVTPLAIEAKSRVDWPQAKAFAQAVCAQMAADSPDRYLIKMTKKLRTGRIFLDYLRNDRMSTAVAPFSPRARPGAPVSMPVTWSQVNARLDPAKYTIRTVPGLLARNKAWAEYCDSLRPLGPAIQSLLKGSR